MKRYFLCLVAILLATSLTCSRAQNTWTQKADFGWPTTGVPPARSDAVSFSIGNFGYVGTGDGMKDFWQYDPTNNSWTQKADYGGGGRTYATGFSIDSLGYIGTGEDDSSNQTADFWEYNPNDNTWTQKADFGGGARHGSIGLSIGSKGYIGMGGLDDNWYSGTLFSDFWEYDPIADTWTQKADFGGGLRKYAVGFSIGSSGYIGTGFTYPYWGNKDFWEYKPNDDTWTQKADFAGDSLWSAVGFCINNMGYVGTGYREPGDDDTGLFWEYNPDTDTWTQKAGLGGSARSRAVGFSIGSKGYIGMGLVYTDYGNYYAGDIWEYDPTADTWAQKADFDGSTQSGSTGFSINGKGYMGTGAEGYPTFYPRKDFWEYDPIADTWTQKADFGGGFLSSATSFSIGSKGYLGTGYNASFPDFTNDFWEYDPNTNTWTQKADFGGVARVSAVAFSIGSKGYLGTGFDIDNHLDKDFWEYDPTADTWTQKADFGGSARRDAVGFSIDNIGYLGTGEDNGGLKNDFWEYDPLTNTWIQKADFAGSARNYAVGFSIGSKGYIGTGSETQDFWEYDPATDHWTQRADFGGNIRSEATGFSIGNRGYLGTGYSGDYYYATYYNDFWEYTPDSSVGISPINEHVSTLFGFPNPTDGAFIAYLKLSDEKNEEVTIEVLNSLGQQVFSQNERLVKGVLQKEIQLNDAADGMYLMKVTFNDQVYFSQISYHK